MFSCLLSYMLIVIAISQFSNIAWGVCVLDDVALFVQIVRAGSLAKASKILSMPANTLSRRLIGLEKKLGAPLLLRSTRSLRCTPDGEKLFMGCCSNIDALNSMVGSIRLEVSGVIGKVRVQISTGLFDFLGGRFWYGLMKIYPGLELEVVVSDSDSNLVKCGIDFLVRVGAPQVETYVIKRVCDFNLGLYASEEYLMERGTPLEPRELVGYDYVVSPRKKDIVIVSEDGGGDYGMSISGRFSTMSTSAQLDVAEQGMGIALINDAYIASKGSGLIRLLPGYYVLGEPVYMVYSGHGALSPCARVVMKYIVDRLKESCGR